MPANHSFVPVPLPNAVGRTFGGPGSEIPANPHETGRPTDLSTGPRDGSVPPGRRWVNLVAGVVGRIVSIAGPALLVVFLCGCATQPVSPARVRPFDFQRDTFAYPNELLWVYHFDAGGHWSHEHREPRPDYANHCFVLARSARQFQQYAKFDPDLPVADEATYRRLIRRVVSINPRRVLPEWEKVVFPGYGDLREFSAAREKLLKQECGGAWESYFQRGNWRMIFPFSRTSQERSAEQLAAELQTGWPPIVHLVRFPQLTINHTILLYDCADSGKEIVFLAYDPNAPDKPKRLVFDRARRTFLYPPSNYFLGGRVDVYEIYCSWDY